MEDENMTLRDLPVQTRNYTIIDNKTGKPVDQSTFSLDIAPNVLGKLKKLKEVNEEKIKAASARTNQDAGLISTFTPEDVTAFTPVYDNEYINKNDFANMPNQNNNTPVTDYTPPTQSVQETYSQDTVLDRVVARDNSTPSQFTSPSDEFDLSDIIGTGNQQHSGKAISVETAYNTDNQTNEYSDYNEQNYEYDNDTQESSNKKEGRFLTPLCYIPLLSILFLFTKKKYLKSHAVEGFQLTLLTLIGAILCAPYVIKTYDLIPSLVFNAEYDTVILVVAVIGLALVVSAVLSMIFGMIAGLCGKTYHVPLLWRKKKNK